jgi:putative ABC transport system ATP-binding protein
MVIKLSNISKIYKTGTIEVQALKDVSISLNAGDFVTVMGPSGSGKSTLMNIIGCLDRATTGEYLLDGINITGLCDRELAEIRNKKVGFVFQSFNLLPKMTALENVEIPLIYAGMSPKKRRVRAIEALDRVSLSDRMKHKPNEMSGGQKQRVAIARALVNNPAVILADEPTGNLDSISGEEIMQILQELNSSGATIVLVTHEKEIADHSGSIMDFYDGFLVGSRRVENPLKASQILHERRSHSTRLEEFK